MAELDENDATFEVPSFEVRYNELPLELLQKVAHCNESLIQLQAQH